MTDFDPVTASEEELRARMDEWEAYIPESLPDDPLVFYSANDRLAELNNGDSGGGE